MPHLADTNLLLRGAKAGHAMQAPALEALAGLARRGEVIYITPHNLYEFWVAAIRPVERNGFGLTAGQADAGPAQLEEIPLPPDAPGVYRE